jgi:hypothetical protein
MPDDLRYVPKAINGFGQRRAIYRISRLGQQHDQNHSPDCQ